MVKCIPCLSDRTKEVLMSEYPHLHLESVPSCRGNKELDMCVGIVNKEKKGRSEYQQFVSECMKNKHIKGFGQAPLAMKECAGEWRKVRNKE